MTDRPGLAGASSRLGDLAISPAGFVFDPVGGGVFTTNATGRLVLEMLARGADPCEIEDKLRASFDTAGADLSRDLLDFELLLRELGLKAESDDPK